MMNKNSGFLVNLEGGEGSGKTSQIPELAEYLRSLGFKVFPTREPGGTSISEQIRDILHDLKNVQMHERTETLLYQSARAQIVEQVLKPHLEDGYIVICDRFFDSTIAYQGFGYGQSISKINDLIFYATSGLTPDLTVLFDVDVEVGMKRKKIGNSEWNRMDDKELVFYEKVKDGYLKMAEIDSRWIVIDANQTFDKVGIDLKIELRRRLQLIGMVEGNRRSSER